MGGCQQMGSSAVIAAGLRCSHAVLSVDPWSNGEGPLERWLRERMGARPQLHVSLLRHAGHKHGSIPSARQIALISALYVLGWNL